MPADRYLTRADLVELLNAHGYPITTSYLNLICAPSSRMNGPPEVGRWGAGRGRPLYREADALNWAESRLRRSQQSAA
jgi:hypothetical protein